MSTFADKAVARMIDVLPRERASRALGLVSTVHAPSWALKAAIATYCRVYNVKMDEAEIPQEGFSSFDAFFTRKLKQGARTIDADANSIVSPCDGRVQAVGTIEHNLKLEVKKQSFLLGDLLVDTSLADSMKGGSFAVIYLSPRDYHRVHAAVSGTLTDVKNIHGTLYSVNPLVMRYVPRLLCRNKRVLFQQKTDRGANIATLMVGAVGVGNIEVCADSGQGTLQKGDEIGVFHLGSTVVLLFGPELRLRWEVRQGGEVRMGSRIATCVDHG